jgi:3'-5' exoribonuclease
MKSHYVAELQPNQLITATFLVQAKDVRQKKTGEPYLSLILGDRTGDLEAKMWDNAEEVLDAFARNDFVKVRGMAQIHHNRLQLTIQRIQKVDERTIEFEDFFPASRRDPEEMFRDLAGIFSAVAHPDLRALCERFLNDPEIASRLKRAPAAKSMHHAYLGGLLEHVLSMSRLAKTAAPHYGADLDLLLTGILLHDIGKIYELSYDRSFSYTTEGHLLGHMHIGLKMLDEKIRAGSPFPARLRTLLEHMILSHHGQLEFGSPKAPMFPEALLLHQLDTLDAKMESMRYSLERDRGFEGDWTGYNAALDRQVLKSEKYVREPETRADLKPGALSGFAEQLQQALGKGERKE